MNYGRLKEDLGRRISLIVGLGKLIELLSDWDGDRRIMQRPQERKKEDIRKNMPTVLEEEYEANESEISAKAIRIWAIWSWFMMESLKRRMIMWERNKTDV